MNTQDVLRDVAGTMQMKIENEMKLGRLLGQLLETFNISIVSLMQRVEALEKQMAAKKEPGAKITEKK